MGDSSSESSYAGSACSRTNEIPDDEGVSERIAKAFDSSTLDRVLALQARTSGLIHAKAIEIREIDKKAANRLEEVQKIISEGSQIAKRIHIELEKLQRITNNLDTIVTTRWPIESQTAREKIYGSSSTL